VPIAAARTAGAISGLAETAVVHRLVRGRLWIGLLATLLVGIVAINVLALSFNATASRTGLRTDILKRQISTLRAQIAAAGVSNERVQSEAANLGMVVPEPGSITYLRPNPGDAATAAKRLVSGELTLGAPSTDSAPAPAVAPLPSAPVAAPPSTDSVPAATPSPAPPGAGTGGDVTSATAAPTAAAPQPAAPAAGGGAAAAGGVATP
jgi:hypothetical protein